MRKPRDPDVMTIMENPHHVVGIGQCGFFAFNERLGFFDELAEAAQGIGSESAVGLKA